MSTIACQCPSHGRWLCDACTALAVRAGGPLAHDFATPAPSLVTQTVPPGPRYRSKTEERFADTLDQQRRAGLCEAVWYEPWKLWLSPFLTYTPDFVVQPRGPAVVVLAPIDTHSRALLTPEYAHERLSDFHLICYEAKPSTGREYEPRRALDRLKMAAHLYNMFTFRLVRWDRGQRGWREETVT